MCAPALVQDVGIEMHPRVRGVEFCDLWQLELIFKVYRIGVLFCGFEESLGGELATVADPGDHALQLSGWTSTRCFSLPMKEALLGTFL